MRLQTRLALLFGAVVPLAAALIGTLSFAAISQRLAAQVDESLLEVSAPLARELGDGRIPDQTGDDRGGRGPRDTSELDLPTQVLLPDGRVVMSDSSEVTLPVDSGDRAIASSTAAAIVFRDVTIESRPYRMVTQGPAGAQGAIQVGRDVTENSEVLAALAWLLALIGIVVAALAGLAGWLVARRAATRLVRLTEAAETVAATGRLDADVPTAGSDEIARLGSAFNAMLLRLGQARDDQQRLVQDAGHELRTPLTSLRTNISLLRHFDAMPAPTRERVIADLDGETKELTTLVDEVLHLAASAPLDSPAQPVELGELARSVAERAFRRTGRRVTVASDSSIVLGKPAALERATWNLVENACKFTDAGTPIELVVDGGSVIVRDGGPGIEPADLPHVFDRFHRATTARSQPGSGLGLAIVRDIAHSHHGRVFAANQPGGGAEVGFWVPTIGPDADPPGLA